MDKNQKIILLSERKQGVLANHDGDSERSWGRTRDKSKNVCVGGYDGDGEESDTKQKV